MFGYAYMLPNGLTWSEIAEQRRKWSIDPMHAPLAVVPGVALAWGRLIFPNNYQPVAT